MLNGIAGSDPWCVKYIYTGPLIYSLDSFRVRFNLSMTRAGYHHPDNLALCGTLGRTHCLGVDIQRDSATGVS